MRPEFRGDIGVGVVGAGPFLARLVVYIVSYMQHLLCEASCCVESKQVIGCVAPKRMSADKASDGLECDSPIFGG